VSDGTAPRGYSGSPQARKLGLKPGLRVALDGGRWRGCTFLRQQQALGGGSTPTTRPTQMHAVILAEAGCEVPPRLGISFGELVHEGPDRTAADALTLLLDVDDQVAPGLQGSQAVQSAQQRLLGGEDRLGPAGQEPVVAIFIPPSCSLRCGRNRGADRVGCGPLG
jgi:hypothetical protein